MKTIKSKFIHFICFIIICSLLYCAFNTNLKITNYNYASTKIPIEFNNFKIIHISDLHNKNFGKNQSLLINKIKNENPNLIIFTGDMIDKNQTDISNVATLLNGISTLCPIYAVNGNHEEDNSDTYIALRECYKTYHVNLLENTSATISINNSSIHLYGLNYYGYIPFSLDHLPNADTNQFNILLQHATNYFDELSIKGYDLMLSGHTHGGIIHFPFLGGLIANNGSLFPKYDFGMFYKNNCTMISSCGLGDSKIPRVFNPPEIVVITLLSQ